jgi:hypothetical protein
MSKESTVVLLLKEKTVIAQCGLRPVSLFFDGDVILIHANKCLDEKSFIPIEEIPSHTADFLEVVLPHSGVVGLRWLCDSCPDKKIEVDFTPNNNDPTNKAA